MSICNEYFIYTYLLPVSGFVFFMESITEIPEQELSENGDFVN